MARGPEPELGQARPDLLCRVGCWVGAQLGSVGTTPQPVAGTYSWSLERMGRAAPDRGTCVPMEEETGSTVERVSWKPRAKSLLPLPLPLQSGGLGWPDTSFFLTRT